MKLTKYFIPKWIKLVKQAQKKIISLNGNFTLNNHPKLNAKRRNYSRGSLVATRSSLLWYWMILNSVKRWPIKNGGLISNLAHMDYGTINSLTLQCNWEMVIISNWWLELFLSKIIIIQTSTPITGRFPSYCNAEFSFFFLFLAWTSCAGNGWVAGDSRRHDAHVAPLWWCPWLLVLCIGQHGARL